MNMLFYQILAVTKRGKIQKSYSKIMTLKYQLQHEMKHFIYLIGLILYQIFMIIWLYHQKKHEIATDNPSINIYIIQIENRITFRKKWERMNLLRSTKSKILSFKCALYWIVLVCCNIVNNIYCYQQDWRDLHIFSPNKLFGLLLGLMSPKNFTFLKSFDS